MVGNSAQPGVIWKNRPGKQKPTVAESSKIASFSLEISKKKNKVKLTVAKHQYLY